MGNCFINPGIIEGFSGPMASGKSRELLKRIDPLRWIDDVQYIGFKPTADFRDMHCRSTNNFISWVYIPETNPRKILDYVKDSHSLVAIDEAQFFDNGIVEVVLELQKNMKNVVFAGLDFDFRREPFGSMKDLSFYANELTKLYAVCECGEKAYYTQKLINCRPASYDSSIISIEGDENSVSYVPRCFKHHVVLGKD